MKATASLLVSIIIMSTIPVIADDKSDAISSSREIMTALANKKFAWMWDTQLSDWYKSKIPSKDSFIANMSLSRANVGDIQTSDIIDVGYSNKDSATGYEGNIYYVNFYNKYQNVKSYERIVVIKEGSSWKLSGMFGTPAP